MKLIEQFYEVTLNALLEAKNNRLWFKIYLKLGKLYEEQADYGKLQKIIRDLYKSCETPEGKSLPAYHLSLFIALSQVLTANIVALNY